MKHAVKIAAVPSETWGIWKTEAESLSAVVLANRARTRSSSRADTAQIRNWKIDTAPTPRTFPAISWKGRTEETSTSMTRFVFSSTIDPITFTP